LGDPLFNPAMLSACRHAARHDSAVMRMICFLSSPSGSASGPLGAPDHADERVVSLTPQYGVLEDAEPRTGGEPTAIKLGAPDVDVGTLLKRKGKDRYAVIEGSATDLQPGLIEQEIVARARQGRALLRPSRPDRRD
jgi:hypothetical protein